MELLNFFDEALQVEREDGSAVLECGDCVIMDNCGFHYARFVEPVLQGMLGDFGLGLIINFISLLIPQISTHQLLAEHETKSAIADVIQCT